MLEAGVLLKVVSEMLDHSSITIIADISDHVSAEMQRHIAIAMEAILTMRARRA